MDYEKKYKDALERAKNLHKDAIDMGENIRAKQCEIIFPELKESEDERIRKAIHIYLDWLDGRKDYAPKGEYSIKDMLAWLEKQGSEENKGNLGGISPNSAWSEEDERNLEGIIDEIEANKNFAPDSDFVTYDRFLSWLKSLKDRVQPQYKWSEEDERNIQDIDSILFYDKSLPEDTCMRLRNWLESLRPQNRWKPSDKQMKALSAINVTGCVSYTGQGHELIKLYNDLKKLKG